MSQSLADQLAASALSAGNAGFIEDLYERYLKDPNAVGPQWRACFGGLQAGAAGEVAHSPIRESLLARMQSAPAPRPAAGRDPRAPAPSRAPYPVSFRCTPTAAI